VAGALVGADLNDLLSDVVVVVLLLALLTLTAYTTLSKARKLYEKETEAFLQADKEADALLKDGKQVPYGTVEKTNGYEDAQEQSSLSSSSETKEWREAAKLVGLFVVVTFINVLKGGPEDGGGLVGLCSCGKTCFWVSEVAIFAIILLFAATVRASLLSRLQLGGPIKSDIAWDEAKTIQYPALAIVAGLAAGLFGIGKLRQDGWIGNTVRHPLSIAHASPTLFLHYLQFMTQVVGLSKVLSCWRSVCTRQLLLRLRHA
jgi:hypothetical protein